MTEKIPDIDADFARVSFRRPILDDGSLGDGPYTMLSETTMEDVRDQRRWGIITEAVRRAVISDSEARELVKQGVGLITGEQVPTEFIGRMQGVAQVNRAAQIAGRGFLGRLALPSVPETAIGKDIRHTPHLDSDQHGIAKGLLELALAHYFEHGRYEKVLQRIQKNAEGPGTTMAEKRLLAQRYCFARDVKLLGLLAEMVNEIPEYHANGEDMEARLKSGTQIVLTRDAYTDDPLLRDPLQWLGRKQLKDRVYRARIGEKDYILKERKTDRHTDTKEKGHQPGNTSRQEFEVAKQMSKLPTSSIGGITVTWEKPLGYVEFPDGYQFCLFEDAGSIIPGDVDSQRTAVTKLGQAIIAHEEAYTAEFKQVQAAATALLQERLDLFNPHNTADKVSGQSKHAGLPLKSENSIQSNSFSSRAELNFDEFAAAKARAMVDQAGVMAGTMTTDAGYGNSDNDGYGFKIQVSDSGTQPVKLMVTGFDYEYFSRDVKIRDINEQRRKVKINDGEGIEELFFNSHTRTIARAAACVMHQAYGWNLPESVEFWL